MKRNKDSLVEIFTDGACSGNPGPGGYGVVMKYNGQRREISGYHPETTNNRMELMAVIEALKLLKRPCNVKVVSDSSYVIKGMTEWIKGWMKRGWLNSQKRPVLNRDLWELLLDLSLPHKIEWVWVKGHDGHNENELCDKMAREAINNEKGVNRLMNR